jgi:hypothetical protein
MNNAISFIGKEDDMELSRDGWQNATTIKAEAEKSSRRQAMIDHWSEIGFAWEYVCSVKGCGGDFDHGAHVRQGTGPVYLAKMCAEHNEQKKTLGEFSLKGGAPLILASELD